MSNVDTTSAQQMAAKTINLVNTVVNTVPTKIVDGMMRVDILQIVFFSTFFGIAAAAVGEKGKPIVIYGSALWD